MIHSFDAEFAAENGLEEAVILHYMQKGESYCVKTLMKVLPYFTELRIRFALRHMMGMGLITSVDSDLRCNRTKWYSLTHSAKE
jgi:hypothetical protein